MDGLNDRVRAAIYEAADAAAKEPNGWYYVIVWPSGEVAWNVQASASYPADEVTGTVPHPLTVWEANGADFLAIDDPVRRPDPDGEHIGEIEGTEGEEYSPDGEYPAHWQRYSEDYSPTAWDESIPTYDYFQHHHGEDYWELIEDGVTEWAASNLRQKA